MSSKIRGLLLSISFHSNTLKFSWWNRQKSNAFLLGYQMQPALILVDHWGQRTSSLQYSSRPKRLLHQISNWDSIRACTYIMRTGKLDLTVGYNFLTPAIGDVRIHASWTSSACLYLICRAQLSTTAPTQLWKNSPQMIIKCILLPFLIYAYF